MYADREEEVLKRRTSSAGNGRSSAGRNGSRRERSPPRSPSTSRSRSYTRSPSPVASRSKRHREMDDESPPRSRHSSGRELNAEERERELQEKLRKRAMMSKRRKQSESPSPPPARSISPDVSDRRRSEQRRERRRGGGMAPLDRVEDEDDRRSTGSRRRPAISRSRSRSRSLSRSPSYSRSARHDSRSKRGSSRRMSPEDDGSERRRSRRDRSEDRYDYDSRAYRRDEPRRHDPYYDPYYDRRGYYPPGPPRYPDRYDGPPRRDRYYDPPAPRSRHTRSPSPPSSARRRRGESKAKSPDPDDYELRSVFCSQLAARLGQRDLGEFFEEKLGEGTVRDVRIITDRNTGRSKGIGYVELKDEALVTQALGLSATPLFGIPIMIQRTEAARNRAQTAPSGSLALPAFTPEQLASLPKINGEPIHIDPANLAGGNSNSRLYVGSLHFSLTEEDIKAVFEPFGAILAVDLHREAGTLKSKGFAFVQFVSGASAEKALQHMNGFELAGRQIKVGHVASRGGGAASSSTGGGASQGGAASDPSGAGATVTTSFDEGGGGGLTANSRAALMEKLARVDHTSSLPAVPSEQQRPVSIPQATSKAVLLKNMFNPEEETERGWDKELAEDVKEECEDKYGKVATIKVDTESAGEIWLKFEDVDGAQKAINGLNGRFFGGRSITAAFISEGIFNSMLS